MRDKTKVAALINNQEGVKSLCLSCRRTRRRRRKKGSSSSSSSSSSSTSSSRFHICRGPRVETNLGVAEAPAAKKGSFSNWTPSLFTQTLFIALCQRAVTNGVEEIRQVPLQPGPRVEASAGLGLIHDYVVLGESNNKAFDLMRWAKC